MAPPRPLLEPWAAGPWRVYRAASPPNRLFIHDGRGRSVAMFFEKDGFPAFENAHLAATAPELVDALVGLVSANGFDQFETAAAKAFELLDLLGVKSD